MSFKILVFLAVTLVPAVAHAEDSAADLFERGKRALERRDPTAACRDFEESLRLDEAVGTYFGLARCEEQLGKVASAWQHLRDGIDRLAGDDPRRLEATANAVRLERRVPRLRLRLPPVQNVRVYRDGLEIDANVIASDLPLDPGTHEVVVLAPDRGTASYRIDLHESELRVLDAGVGPTLAAEGKARRLRLYGEASGVLGGGLMVTGLVTGIVAATWSHVVHDHCDATHLCDARGTDALGHAHTFGAVSTGTWIAGGVLVAAGAVLFWLGRPRAAMAASTGAIRF